MACCGGRNMKASHPQGSCLTESIQLVGDLISVTLHFQIYKLNMYVFQNLYKFLNGAHEAIWLEAISHSGGPTKIIATLLSREWWLNPQALVIHLIHFGNVLECTLNALLKNCLTSLIIISSLKMAQNRPYHRIMK